ncbi:MAG: C25 family cysteine peptidase [Chloroflexales bacterium]|nr:C25 family cysteine peptidase [Chloroflexales bacterium]
MGYAIRPRIFFRCVSLLGLALVLALSGGAAGAQPEPAAPLRVTTQDGGVRLVWQRESRALDTHPTTLATLSAQFALPLVQIGDATLPAHMIALRADDDDHAAVSPRVEELQSRPWHGVIPPAAAPIPQTVHGEQRPDLAVMPDQALPATPLVIVREGRMRGVRIIVVAFSPMFIQDGEVRATTDFRVTIPNVSLLKEDAAQILARSGPFLTSGPAPTNRLAATNAVKIAVTRPGIQRVTREDLAVAGIDIAAIDPALLRLRHNGDEVALEVRGTDELRFYAATVGDRWNAGETYWLTVESTPSTMRMTSRDVMPFTAPVRTNALEHGLWRANALYDSTLPGPAGDHWYAVDLRTGLNQKPALFNAPLTPTLPLATGNVTLTVEGVAYTQNLHALAVTMGEAMQSAEWRGTGNWSQTFTFAANQPKVRFTLLPKSVASGIQLQQVRWERSVGLDFGGNGGLFAGLPGQWRYQLSNPAADVTLYDVTDPRAPQILTGGASVFEDGPEPRDYLLAGPGTLHTPSVYMHRPVDLAKPLNVAVLYIAPAGLHAALDPLVAHRRAQGYTVQVVDVQAIYDAWSFGQVSPDAIRDFLRAWTNPPLAVTLVGDGTFDPHDYLQKGEKNVNLIPPYLATVDPIMKETACESCYAQLDGADPVLSGDTLPDLLFGRLPVKDAAELEALVAKIIGYETDSTEVAWRARVAYIADNPDDAGDFATVAELSAALQPQNMAIGRVYYDPAPSLPGRVTDAVRAYQGTQAVFNAGAGLINFIGHGNAFQWAVTDSAADPAYLLGLYNPDAMTNGKRLPVVLSLSCLTSAFHFAAFSGTTIDERLLLATNGGAVAVWGSTGAGVLFGHTALQRGFYQMLWSADSTVMGGGSPAYLGELTAAGFLELFTNGNCCQDAIRTYALLGDPLTVPQVLPGAAQVYLPVALR